MSVSIKQLSKEDFQAYGYLIQHDETLAQSFQIVLRETENVGWRIAVSKIMRHSINEIARHPSSMESFEPLSGVTLLCVSLPETPEQCEVFLLDKPICLKKNIWHATMALSESSLVKICENNEVDSEEYAFERPLQVLVQAQELL